MDLAIKIGMLVIFFGVMIGVGLYCRKHSTDVNGFVLGGRSVGPRCMPILLPIVVSLGRIAGTMRLMS